MAQQPANDEKDDVPENETGYKVAAKASIGDLMDKDKDDEALAKYKAQLLGDQKDKIIDADDKRQVFFDALVVMPEGRDPIKLDPSKLKKDTVAFVLKEKAKYSIRLEFRVQREIVLGLKKHQRVYKKGIRVENSLQTIGSYAPTNKKSYDFTFPEEVTPDGMLARGTYVAKTSFIDDDKTNHLEFEYSFKIAKDWE